MSLIERAKRALSGLNRGKPSDERSKGKRSGPDRRGGDDGGRARSTRDAASAPNPSVAAEEVD